MAWDVRGKTVVVTGATSGIGLEASAQLAGLGAAVTMVGRDPARTSAAAAEVTRRAGSAPVTTLLCDFASQAAIRRLASEIHERHDRLDVLVNNAGAVNKTRRVTSDGIEATFAVNHLGYFLLTNLVTDLLTRSAPARVVTVASVGHRAGTMDFDDLGYERGYSIMKAYQRSKLGNVLFAHELARRLADVGVTSNALHPGAVDTNIWSGAPLWARPIIALALRPFFISAERGGERITELVADPALEGVTGAYFEDGKRVEPAPLVRDQDLARRLWDVSEQLVGLGTHS
ncbi:MAG: SDR family NAD(P)-dependent oxidoreductase [Micromonosporaceae bacterium]|nr:SDR family NAD(P)-dependent oxidoreductase [Micromonosporaceae bacterium]